MKNNRGFTIVELLIVIVVIGILAAIVIVAYNGIQNKAYDTTAKNDLAVFKKKVENVKTMSTGELYPSSNVFTPDGSIIFTKSAYSTGVNNVIYCWSLDKTEFGAAVYTKSGNKYFVSNTKGVTDYTWAWTNTGASTCPNMLVNNTSSPSYTWIWGWTNNAWAF